jgi:hypothetical protein
MIAVLLFFACSQSPSERESNEGPRRVVLDESVPDGLSGLTRDGDGVLWAAAETARSLVAIRNRRDSTVVPVIGVPEEIDLESIEWMDGHRFVAGTESMDTTRTGDPMVLIEIEGERARVMSQVLVPYSELGLVAEENHGIESLCWAHDRVVVAFENVLQDEGRIAPIAVVTLEPFAIDAHRLVLTSETGKIAGLACRAAGDSIEAFAIERHYAVMRIVRFTVPRGGDSRRIRPRVVADLAGRLDGDPNLEGIAIDGPDLVLVVDNHYGRRTGPNELVVLGGAAR